MKIKKLNFFKTRADASLNGNTKEKAKKYNPHKMRKALSLVEAIFVLVLLGIIIYKAVSIYGNTKASTEASSLEAQFSSVVSGLERAKKGNGGAYPQSSTKKIPAIPNLVSHLGGSTKTRAIAGWTYSCATGSNSTITIKTSPIVSDVVRNLLKQTINSNYSPYKATISGTIITVTSTANVCD